MIKLLPLSVTPASTATARRRRQQQLGCRLCCYLLIVILIVSSFLPFVNSQEVVTDTTTTISNNDYCPDVINGEAALLSSNTYRISATISSPYEEITKWEQYSNEFRVIDITKTTNTVVNNDLQQEENASIVVLGTRTLLHPHDTEQPFTRSTGSLQIPETTTLIEIQAKDLINGYDCGGTTFIINLQTGEGNVSSSSSSSSSVSNENNAEEENDANDSENNDATENDTNALDDNSSDEDDDEEEEGSVEDSLENTGEAPSGSSSSLLSSTFATSTTVCSKIFAIKI